MEFSYSSNLTDLAASNDVTFDTNLTNLSPAATTKPFTNESESSTLRPRNQDLARVEIVIQATILALNLLGNGAVLSMLACMSRRDRSLGRMYTMIGHLSCADLFVAVFNILPQLLWDVTERFQGGRVVCKLIKYAQVAAIYAPAYVLLSTALDRYISICHPMRSHTWTLASAHRLVAYAWAVALLFSVPQLVIFDYVEIRPSVFDCWEHFSPAWTMQLYITWFTLAVYVVPLLLLAVIYTKISLVVWSSSSDKAAANVSLRKVVKTPEQNGEVASQLFASSKQSDNLVSQKDTFGDDKSLRGKSVAVTDITADAVTSQLSSPRAQAMTLHLANLGAQAMTSQLASPDEHAMTSQQSNASAQVMTSPQAKRGNEDCVESAGSLSAATPSKMRTRTIRLTLTVVVSYLVCWGPFFFAQMWYAWDPNSPQSSEETAMVLTLLLASLNSCINPWIYLAFSNHLRRRLKRICSCFACFCCGCAGSRGGSRSLIKLSYSSNESRFSSRNGTCR